MSLWTTEKTCFKLQENMLKKDCQIPLIFLLKFYNYEEISCHKYGDKTTKRKIYVDDAYILS